MEKLSSLNLFVRTTFVASLLLLPAFLVPSSVTILGYAPVKFFSAIAIGIFVYPLSLFILRRLPRFFVKAGYIYHQALLVSLVILLGLGIAFSIDSLILKVIAVLLAWATVAIVWASVVDYSCDYFSIFYVDRIFDLFTADFVIEFLRLASRRVRSSKARHNQQLALDSRFSTVSITANDDHSVPVEPLFVPDYDGATAGVWEEVSWRLEQVPLPKADGTLPAFSLSIFNRKIQPILDHFYDIINEDIIVDEDNENDKSLVAYFLQQRERTEKRGLASFRISADLLSPKDVSSRGKSFNSSAVKPKNNKRQKFNVNNEKAAHIASEIYHSLKKKTEASLDVNKDVLPYFMAACADFSTEKKKLISDAVNSTFLECNSDGVVYESELSECIQKSYRERKRLAASLLGMRAVIRKVGRFMGVMIYLFCAIVTLMVFGIDPSSTLSSFSSVLLSFAFLFGGMAKQSFEGAVFIFFRHPYDVGDRVFVNGSNYIVTKINLLCTVMERWDGQLIYVSNANLAASSIINSRRSTQLVDILTISVQATTPNERIQELHSKLMEMAEKNGGDFEKKVGVTPQPILDMESVLLNISYKHKSNNQNWDLYLTRKAKFTRHLCKILKELDIKWTPLERPVEMRDRPIA